jgi:hypothetical protein
MSPEIADLWEATMEIVAESPLPRTRSGEVIFSCMYAEYHSYEMNMQAELLVQITVAAAKSTMRRGMPEEIIISFSSSPVPHLGQERFSISFTDEKYFELLDSILEFTGIPADMVDVNVREPLDMDWWWGTEEIVDIEYVDYGFGPIHVDEMELYEEQIEAHIEELMNQRKDQRNGEFGIVPFNQILVATGQALMRRPDTSSPWVRAGTVGHPTGASRSGFMTAGHGNMPRNTRIYWGTSGSTALFIGMSNDEWFNPFGGEDFTHVGLMSNFRVYDQPPLSNLFGATPPVGTTVRFLGSVSGLVSGQIQQHGATAPVPGGHTYLNVVKTNVRALPGDSGGAFIHGNTAIGTLVAASQVHAESYFIPAQRYQNRVW